VCIVNWNARDVLRDCLASLDEQAQGVRLEVIVVDNGSTDGAAEMVARDFPQVVLVRNAVNRGFARANNQAAAHARGRYLFFLNNDTVVPPGALAQLTTHADAHPEVGMIGPRLRDADGRVQASYRPQPTLRALLHRHSLLRGTGLFRRAYRRHRRDEFDPEQRREVETLMGAALFLPRRVFLQCGPWDEDFPFGGEDLYFSACVRRYHRLVYLPEVEVIHHGGVSTRQRAGAAGVERAAGYVHYLRRCGYPRRALWVYKLAVTLDLPVQFVAKGLQYLARRLRGRTEAARASRLAWDGARHFLMRGLVTFWRT
jgi:GT2 family glycosyltransferase